MHEHLPLFVKTIIFITQKEETINLEKMKKISFVLVLTLFLALLITITTTEYIDYINNDFKYMTGMPIPIEEIADPEYLDRLHEESYIPGYSWEDLIRLRLTLDIGSDSDEDGVSDYDELTIYRTDPRWHDSIYYRLLGKIIVYLNSVK